MVRRKYVYISAGNMISNYGTINGDVTMAHQTSCTFNVQSRVCRGFHFNEEEGHFLH